MKTAFVASTLPARFLLDHWERLGISRLVCGSESLTLSFQFLKEKDPALEITFVPALREGRQEFLNSEVAKSESGIVIFHECCWRELDLAILKLQPSVDYYPAVTLNSWKKLSRGDLNLFKLFFRFLKERNKNILRLMYFSLKHGADFDFYEVVEDNGNQHRSFQTAIKEHRLNHLHKSDECLKSRQVAFHKAKPNTSKTIMFIVATDVVDNVWQEEVFYQVAELCRQQGYDILVKDHPNPNARLNLKNIGKNISPHLPFEVIEEPYLAKIGLFSTALAFEPERSLSIAELFLPAPLDFTERKTHLLSLPGGDQITFIKNLDSLKDFLISHA